MDRLTLEPFAARLRWRFAKVRPLDQWQALFADLLDALALACAAEEPSVIGHIKGLALLPGGGYLRGSTVSARHPADVEAGGNLTGEWAGLEMALNVLVYGLPLSKTRLIVLETGRALARRRGAELQVLGPGADPTPDVQEGTATTTSREA